MIGVLASSFDPFPHPGVIWAMRQAVWVGGCESIVALLHIDPSIERPQKRKPIMSVEERQVMLSAIGQVSVVHLYSTEDELLELLRGLCPHVRVLGEDYIGNAFTGQELGQPVFYAKRREEWSGTKFTERIRKGGDV